MVQPYIKLIVLYLKQMLPQISLFCCMSLFPLCYVLVSASIFLVISFPCIFQMKDI